MTAGRFHHSLMRTAAVVVMCAIVAGCTDSDAGGQPTSVRRKR